MTYFAFGSLPSLELAAVGTSGQSLASAADCGVFLGTAVASVCRGPAGPLKWGLYEVSSAINFSLPH